MDQYLGGSPRRGSGEDAVLMGTALWSDAVMMALCWDAVL